MLDQRKKADLYNAFENADTILLKKYVSSLDELPLIEVNEAITNIRVGSNACLYHVDKIVYDFKKLVDNLSMCSNQQKHGLLKHVVNRCERKLT